VYFYWKSVLWFQYSLPLLKIYSLRHVYYKFSVLIERSPYRRIVASTIHCARLFICALLHKKNSHLLASAIMNILPKKRYELFLCVLNVFLYLCCIYSNVIFYLDGMSEQKRILLVYVEMKQKLLKRKELNKNEFKKLYVINVI